MATRRSARLGALVANAKAPDAVSPPARSVASRKRKAVDSEPAPAQTETAPAPTTPRRRRTAQPTPKPEPPSTPTPAAVRLIAEGVQGAKPAAVNRLADPNRTNAALLSPETSRLIAPRQIVPPSPSKLSFSQTQDGPTTTTATLLDQALAHLIKVDARMKPLIDKHHCHVFSPAGLAEKVDPFESLASSIISQQVSGAAAKSIKARFIALFDDDDDKETSDEKHRRFPHPSQVAVTPLETLRTAGLSQRKAEYVQGLAQKFASGELSAQMLADASYEEVLERLIAVRGLGRWSVEMFACFGLKRMDVFSVGDLGVQRGMAAFVGRDVAKLKSKGGKWKYMSEKEMEEISERFRPYRSLFMWYMWRVEETDVSTME